MTPANPNPEVSYNRRCGGEGVGGATRALTCARQAAANPPNGEALDSVDVVGLGLKLVQTVPVPRDSLVTTYHTIIDEESGVASAYLGDSRFSNIMWCPKRLPLASLPRVDRAVIETLDANWPDASSGWVLDGVDYKTKLAWFNAVKDRVMISIPLPRGSAISLPQLYKDGSAIRKFFDAKMAIFVKAEKIIDAATGELADKLSRNNDPVETKDQLVHRWFQMLEGDYNSAQVDEDLRSAWQRVVEKIRDGEATSQVCF